MSYKDDDAVAREVTGGPYGDGCAFLLMPFAIVIGLLLVIAVLTSFCGHGQ
jgi:hypothetical protein